MFLPGRSGTSRCSKGLVILSSGAVLLAGGPSARGEDSDAFRPYVQLRSAALNEHWGVQDGWGLGIGANLNYYLGIQMDFDAYERVVEWPGVGTIFENSVMSYTPEIRLRYPLANGKWVPYIFAGPGVTTFQFNDRKDPAFHKEVHGDSTQLSAMFGAGLEYYLADNISFSVEAKYNWISRDTVTVDGERRDVDYSSALVMFGIRAYFRENHHQPLLEENEREVPDRFWLGFRYGSSILLDNRLNRDLRFEPVAAALGGAGNQAASFIQLGYNLGDHWAFGLNVNYAEYNLASDHYGVVGEYANTTMLPEVRWRWTFLDGKLSPFVTAGVGLTYSEFNDRKPPGENLKIDGKGVYPSADVGAGAEYFFARNISVSAESHYMTSWNHRISINGVDEGRGSFSAMNLYLGLRFYLIER